MTTAALPTLPIVPDAEWARLLAVYAATAQAQPEHNCSVPGNPRAARFAAWCRPFLRGYVLDLGCGPYPLPLYLEDYPLALVAGIDPLPPLATTGPHPFRFVQGVAEALPWPDRWFDTVVCATSLDHLRDPALALAEVARVLVPGGRLVLWETLLPEDQAGPDGHHAYRLTPARLAALLAPRFAFVAEEVAAGAGQYDVYGVYEVRAAETAG